MSVGSSASWPTCAISMAARNGIERRLAERTGDPKRAIFALADCSFLKISPTSPPESG